MFIGIRLHWLEMFLFRRIWNHISWYEVLLVIAVKLYGQVGLCWKMSWVWAVTVNSYNGYQGDTSDFSKFIQYDHLIMFLSLCLVYICCFLTLIQLLSATVQFPSGDYSRFISSLIYMLHYVSQEYFYTSKPLSSNLFSDGAVIHWETSLTQRRDSCIKFYSVWLLIGS